MSQFTTFLRAPLEPTEEQRAQNKSIGGFFGNVVGDVGEFVSGLSSLAGMVASDVGSLGREAITLGDADTSFYTDDIITSLDDLGKEYWDIYKPGGKKLGDYAYNDPLSLVGDALTVLTLGGLGVAKAAQAGSKLGSIAGGLNKLAVGGEAASTVGLAPRLVQKTLGLTSKDILSAQAGGYAPRVGTRMTLDAMGRPLEVQRHINPIKRLAFEGGLNKFLTEDVSKMGARADELIKQADFEFQAAKTVDAGALQTESRGLRTLAEQAEKYGVTRIDRQFVSDHKLRKAANKLFGYHSSRFIKQRNDAVLEVQDFFRKKGFTDDDLEGFYHRLQTTTGRAPGHVDFADLHTFTDPSWQAIDVDDLQTMYDQQILDPATGEVRHMSDEEFDNFMTSRTSLNRAPMPEEVVARLQQELPNAQVEGDRVIIQDWQDFLPISERIRDSLGGQTLEVGHPAGRLNGMDGIDPTAGPNAGGFIRLVDQTGAEHTVRIQTPAMAQVADALDVHVPRIRRLILNQAPSEEISSAIRYAQRLTEAAVIDSRRFLDGWGSEEALERYAQRQARMQLADEGELNMQGDDFEALDPTPETPVTPEDAKFIQAAAELRLLVDRRLTQPLLERGLLDYTTVLDRQYMPHRLTMRQKAVAEAEELAGIEGADPEQYVDELLATYPDDYGSGIDFDDEFMLAGKQAPVYFPHIDPRRTKFMDFLLRRGTRNQTRGGAPFLKPAMGHLFENDLPIKDPVEAYARRASQVQKYLETLDLVEETVLRFGRRIKWDDELGPGEVVFSPTGARALFRSKIDVEEAIAEELMRAGMATEDAFADGIREALVKGPRVNARDAQYYAIPKAVGRELDDYTKVRLGWKARMFWDAPINVWRAFVLAGSPRWVFYNLLGNVTFLKMQGGKLRDVIRMGLSPKFRESVDELFESLPEEVKTQITGGFFSSGHQYITHFGGAENTAVAQAYHVLQGTKPAQWGRWTAQKVRRLNEVVEDAFRSASYLQGVHHAAAARGVKLSGMRFIKSEKTLRKLAEDGITPEDAVKALEEVNYFFNDYNALGPWERNVIRRFISPFYSFYKHIIKLFATYPIKHPVRFAVLNHMTQFANEMNDVGPVPEWLEGSVPTDAFGSPAGPMDTRFFNSRGANPFTAIGQPLDQFAFGQMNPILKTAYEQITGQSALTGEEFSAPDVITPFGSDQQYRVNPDTLTVEPVDRVAPSLPYHIATQFPQFTLGRDLLQATLGGGTGSRYGTGQVIQQPGGEEPLYPKDPLQQLMQFVGISTTDYNLPKYQSKLIQEEADALRALLSQNPNLFVGG